jgi:hypothetical protein
VSELSRIDVAGFNDPNCCESKIGVSKVDGHLQCLMCFQWARDFSESEFTWINFGDSPTSRTHGGVAFTGADDTTDFGVTQ